MKVAAFGKASASQALVLVVSLIWIATTLGVSAQLPVGAGDPLPGITPSEFEAFRLGIDDRDPRKGLSNLKRLLREVASDAELPVKLRCAFSEAMLVLMVCGI